MTGVHKKAGKYICTEIRKMFRIKNPVPLMILTILAITAFQAWWLKQSYNREERAMMQKADMLFRESIFSLQGFNLRLDTFSHVPARASVNIIRDTVRSVPRQQVVNMVNLITAKAKDSGSGKQRVVISMDNETVFYRNDSMRHTVDRNWNERNTGIIRFLYGIDSLQDSIKVRDIETSFSRELTKEKMNIPFTVLRDTVNVKPGMPFKPNEVTVGFSKPVRYSFVTGNTVPYLLKRISSPILFSLFLVGFTILSFFILYRSLLQQRRLTALKNDFISNITHELKTPIATVTVAIEALRNFNAINDPKRTTEYLDISRNELQRLSMLVDKVLKLSMFENREVELRPEPFDLHQLVLEVVGSFRLQSEKYNAKIHVTTEGHAFTLHADRLHIMSVIYNLLDNALKYSGENPQIGIMIREEGELLKLTVKDNGKGIPREYQDRIFEKFFRVPQGDRHDVKGYGLGLSYVNHIVKKHHGTIELESEEGRGSVFHIIIPKKYG